MTTLGGPGAVFLIVLENLSPPLPSEVILPPAGFSVGTDTPSMTILTAILWRVFGFAVGMQALYGVGARLGSDRARRILARVPLVKTSDIDRTEALFHRRGGWTVFAGRMASVFRLLISIPAGATRVNPLQFTFLTMAGVAIWSTILVSTEYVLGASWSVVKDCMRIFSKVAIAACVATPAWFIAVRLRVSRHVTAD